MAIEDLITAAQAEVTAAESLPETDTTRAEKITAAKAKVAGLEQAKSAGYTLTRDDANNIVTQRLPEAATTERKALAARLGVKVEDLDDELKRLENERKGAETEAQRQARELATKEAELATERQAREKDQRTAESAREVLRSTLIRNAVESELRNQGVVISDEVNYLNGAYNLTDRSGVSVDIEIKDDGSLEVKGEVQGAKEAAAKTRKDYSVMFGETVENPTQTPPGKGGGGGGGGKKPVYNPPLAVQGPQGS